MNFLSRAWLAAQTAVVTWKASSDAGRNPFAPFAFADVTGMRRTNAGETVSPGRALTLAAYFAAIRVISEDVAKLPLGVYRKKIPRGNELLPEHPIEQLLDVSPNPEQTSYTFRETMTQWALGWGNGYAEIVRDGAGRVRQLWPIHPSRVTLIRIDGKLKYRVTADMDPASLNASPRYAEFDPEDIFHLRGMGTGLLGYSIAAFAAETIGVGLAAETFGASFFGQGATVSGILTHPDQLDEVARQNLRESWAKTYGGAKNSHKVAILEEGVQFQTISVPPEQAQFLETRQFTVEEVCRWFRVAPHKIQHLLRSSFSNIEQQSIEHVTDTLMPWLVRWEKEVKRQLIVGEPMVYVQHDVNGLLRGDANARSNWYRTMINIGAMSPNDVRECEGLNPVPGTAGDKYYMQTNMSTLDRIESGEATAKPGVAGPRIETAPAEDGGTAEAAERRQQFLAQLDALGPAFEAAADRVLRKEAIAIERKGKLVPVAWLNDFYSEWSTNLVDAMLPVAQSACRIGANVLGRELAHVDVDSWSATYAAEAKKHFSASASIPATHVPSLLAGEIRQLILAAYPE